MCVHFTDVTKGSSRDSSGSVCSCACLCVCAYVCACVCEYVCVCVCVQEREERIKKIVFTLLTSRTAQLEAAVVVCVCVRV